MKKLIILADVKDLLPLLDREEISISRFAQLLNEAANKALKKQDLCEKLDMNYRCENMCLTRCMLGNGFWKLPEE